jgi:hypothetical protein
MDLSYALRVYGICVALPASALCVAFAWHLWVQGKDPVYRPVFHAAVYAYGGLAVLCKGLVLSMYLSLDFPYQWGLWPLVVGMTLVLFGMARQIMLIPHRKW